MKSVNEEQRGSRQQWQQSFTGNGRVARKKRRLSRTPSPSHHVLTGQSAVRPRKTNPLQPWGAGEGGVKTRSKQKPRGGGVVWRMGEAAWWNVFIPGGCGFQSWHLLMKDLVWQGRNGRLLCPKNTASKLVRRKILPFHLKSAILFGSLRTRNLFPERMGLRSLCKVSRFSLHSPLFKRENKALFLPEKAMASPEPSSAGNSDPKAMKRITLTQRCFSTRGRKWSIYTWPTFPTSHKPTRDRQTDRQTLSSHCEDLRPTHQSLLSTICPLFSPLFWFAACQVVIPASLYLIHRMNPTGVMYSSGSKW